MYDWIILVCGVVIAICAFLSNKEQSKTEDERDRIASERDRLEKERDKKNFTIDSLNLVLTKSVQEDLNKMSDGSSFPYIESVPLSPSTGKVRFSPEVKGTNDIRTLEIYVKTIPNYLTLDERFFSIGYNLKSTKGVEKVNVDRLRSNIFYENPFLLDFKDSHTLYVFQLDTDSSRYYQYIFYDFTEDAIGLGFVSFLVKGSRIIKYDESTTFPRDVDGIITINKHFKYKNEDLIGKQIQKIFL